MSGWPHDELARKWLAGMEAKERARFEAIVAEQALLLATRAKQRVERAAKEASGDELKLIEALAGEIGIAHDAIARCAALIREYEAARARPASATPPD